MRQLALPSALQSSTKGINTEFYPMRISEALDLAFRCIVADRNELDHDKFNDGDAELGFYKLYYQMLVHWLQPGNSYHIYLDWQQNQAQNRFHDLATVLTARLRNKASIACLEPVTSSNLPLLGLADVLIGAVGYAWNGLGNSAAKLRVVDSAGCNRVRAAREHKKAPVLWRLRRCHNPRP